MRSRTALAFSAVAIVLAAAGAFAWRAVQRPDRAPALAPLLPSAPPVAQAIPSVHDDDAAAREALAPVPDDTFQSLETTVVWPLEVELELVRVAHAPEAEGVPQLGTGATAKLGGSILGASGHGLRATVSFFAGANQGRVLYCDGLGRFGATDLFPGLSIVQVRAPGFPGSMREVRLRQDRETLLNIGYGRPAFVEGEVFDAAGKPLAGAKVTMDGQMAETSERGVFQFGAMTSGEVLVQVEKPGFARYREIVNVTAASRIEKGRLKFALQAGARLVLTIEESINARQEALVFVLPAAFDGQRKFPWSELNPVRMWPGGTTTLEDLPAGNVHVRLFHAGARAKPARVAVSLSAGETATQTLHLEPAPMLAGRVMDGAEPAVNATVRLEAPDRVAAALSVFGESNYLYLESEVFPSLPPAVQEATTNARGEFQLTSYEDVAPIRYLTATSRDGHRVASHVARPGDERVELALAPLLGGEAELVLALGERYQALPIKVTVNGEPREPAQLPPGRDLHVDGLVEGSWIVSVRWSSNSIHTKVPVELRPSATIEAKLPEGAVQGQDEETRRRAGLR